MPSSSKWFIISVTFLGAFILTLLPMPDWTIWLRPTWILLVLIYWTMEVPYRVNVGIAWFVGILLDVLNGTLLGEHALGFILVIYIVSRIHSRLRMFPLSQQGLSIFFLVLLYLAIIYCIQGFVGNLPHGWFYWAPAATSMILWPWVYSILRDCRSRFKVT
ncbi:MAG: rod shape-determining protein MreD [Gammaproteobacteria bacterium]